VGSEQRVGDPFSIYHSPFFFVPIRVISSWIVLPFSAKRTIHEATLNKSGK
jgi:hypothetical protein